VAEYERYAKDTLSRNAHGYYASGSNDMITLRENREAYSRLRLMPKILVDVSSISTGFTNIFVTKMPTLSLVEKLELIAAPYSSFYRDFNPLHSEVLR
jgi:FMN-dependent dehydrogenase